MKRCAACKMDARIVRVERNRLLQARHRLLVTAQPGEHPAEIRMRLCPVGREFEGAAERGLGFGEPFETHQGGGAIEMCAEKLRDQRDGPCGACQTRCEFLLLIERSG